MAVTIKDVAIKAGVSISTVSRLYMILLRFLPQQSKEY